MLCAVAVLIFLLQTGILQGLLEVLHLLPRPLQPGEEVPPEQQVQYEGIFGEIRLFVYGFLASMLPTWQPPEYLQAQVQAREAEVRRLAAEVKYLYLDFKSCS